MQGPTVIFYIIVLLISVILHEMAHGYAALSQGDQTAWRAGRLTFNPLKHLDLWGSILLPLFLVLSHAGFVLGWAKPVPYNPDNLRNQTWGKVFVAVAGIMTNLAIALIFGLLLRFISFGETISLFIQIIVFTNILLAVFNLVPIPPLDGSKIVLAFVHPKYDSMIRSFERYSMIVLLIFIFYGWGFITPVIFKLFTLFTGLSF